MALQHLTVLVNDPRAAESVHVLAAARAQMMPLRVHLAMAAGLHLARRRLTPFKATAKS